MEAMGERGKGDGLRSSSEFCLDGYQFWRRFFFGAYRMDLCFCKRFGMAHSPLVPLTSLHVLLFIFVTS